MRVLAFSGLSHRVIAKRYEVDQSTATRAINGDTHRRVLHPIERPDQRPGQPRFLEFEAAVEAVRASPESLEVIEEWPGEPVTVTGLIRAMRQLEAIDDALADMGVSSADAASGKTRVSGAGWLR